MTGSPAAGLVRTWVDLYTRGLPADLRAARRDEVADDLWCEQEEAATLGRSAGAVGADMTIRLLFGMPADVGWRLTYRGKPRQVRERSGSMSTRVIGAAAIVGVLTLVFGMIMTAELGDALWATWFAAPVLLTMVIAFVVFAAGMAWRFKDRMSPLGAIGVGGIVFGLLLMAAGFFALVPFGSALLMADLSRSGAIPRVLGVAHAVAGIIWAAGLMVGPEGLGVLSLVSGLTYLGTWVAIGVWLVRGVPRATPRSDGPVATTAILNDASR